ncbi:MAG TPA: serine hydrolase [Chitinophagaceae bacterium]|nr:serine hydrolase [Chitinophagaceae bacterium]
MKVHIYKFFKTAALLVFLSTIVLISSFAQGFSPQTISRLQHVLDSFQNNSAIEFVGGMSAAIKVDSLAMWQGVAGYSARNVDGENNLLPGGTLFTTSTLSRIFSITKSFTAPLVLELAKEGAFKLDDPVNKFVPLNLINPGLDGSVTIRQLLAHESGYSDYETDEIQFQMAVAFQPTRIWTPYEIIYFVHQLAEHGTVRNYSSTNYILLGAIVEAVTGRPIEQFYRERFFTPLGLNSMYFAVREQQPAGTVLASPHENISPFNPIFQFTGQPTFPDAYTNIFRFPYDGIASAAFSGGAIISNAADVAEWGNSLFGARATSRDILDTMLTSIPSTPDEDGDYLGYGIWRSSRMSTTTTFLGHDGNAPGYRAIMYYQPERKMTIAVLTNFHGADIYAIGRALYAALPNFIGGNDNRKEPKIILCYNGHMQTVDRNAADVLIRKGAYLGGCDQPGLTNTSSPIPESTLAMNRASIRSFPNPASGHFSVFYSVPKAVRINIALYSSDGKLMETLYNGWADKNLNRRLDVPTGALPKGVYMCRISTADGIFQQKVVIQ